MIIPPLAVVTGAQDIAPVHGGFGPSPDPFLWQGACYTCGKPVACVAGYSAPECVDCMRTRHGIVDRPIVDRSRVVPPVVAAILPGERPRRAGQQALQVKQPQVTVLRPATELSPIDSALPGGVRALLSAAASIGHPCRVTAAVAADERGVLATVAVRVPGLGYAVYRRRDGGAWGFSAGAVADPKLRPVNVGQFVAALMGVEYVPPAPRELAAKGACPTCGGEVSLTKTGAVYASHRCKINNTEGRS